MIEMPLPVSRLIRGAAKAKIPKESGTVKVLK
jgi:hypothetical protein